MEVKIDFFLNSRRLLDNELFNTLRFNSSTQKLAEEV